MVYDSMAPLGLLWHARRVTDWRPPDLAVIRSSCTSGVHTGTWSGTACREWGRKYGTRGACTHHGSPDGLALTPAGARSLRTGGSAALLGPGHCGCPSAARSACSSCAAQSRGVLPHGSRLRGGVSCWAPVGATGGGRGWGRGLALTGARVDGERLRRAGAPLQAVLEAVWWVVAVGAGHTPNSAAKSRRLRHSEDGTVGAHRCEFVDGRHHHEHGHAGCGAHSGSATLAPACTRLGMLSAGQAGGRGDGGTTPWVGISGTAGEEHFLCDLLVLGSGRGFSHLPSDVSHCTPPEHSLLRGGSPPADTTMVAVNWKPTAATASES